MTFSIVARCEKTGMFGLAVSSSSPAVAARCAFARAGVGAVSSQNITDPSLGTKCLDLMESGMTASAAIENIVKHAEHIGFRQLLAVDRAGGAATYSGEKTLGINATDIARDVACAGNLLANEDVPEAMVRGFENSEGHLGDRLLAAMQAGLDAGGEAGPVHSAGMMIVDEVSWPVANLRVDWNEAGKPIEELKKLWKIYEPQLEDYVKRALDPSDAPTYGVPGDE